MRIPGFIYVLQNPAFPGLLKIGYTTRTPEERAEELSRHTGVPTPYRVVFSEFFEDCQGAERAIHNALAARRWNKEFFRITVDEAVAVIRQEKRREGKGRRWGCGRSPRRAGTRRRLGVVILLFLLLIPVTASIRGCRQARQQRWADSSRFTTREVVVEQETPRAMPLQEVETLSSTAAEPEPSVQDDEAPLFTDKSDVALSEQSVSEVFFTESDDYLIMGGWEQAPPTQVGDGAEGTPSAALPERSADPADDEVEEGVHLTRE